MYDSCNCNGNRRAGGGGEEGPDRAQSSSGVTIVQMLSQTYHISQLFVGVEWQNGYPTWADVVARGAHSTTKRRPPSIIYVLDPFNPFPVLSFCP